MIYFDNAATGGFKPGRAIRAAETVIKYLSANPGRSGHRLSVTGANIVYECRKVLAKTFGGVAERVAFTKNCTEALNTAIFGTLKKGGKVITTVYEHNSVLRPLYALQKQGLISLETVYAPPENLAQAIESKLTPDVYLIVTTSASNVTGDVMPVNEIGKLAKNHGVLYLVDGAQGAGHVPLSLEKQNIDMLAVAGHKGLCGVMGSGALIFGENVEVLPLSYGGTGTESFSVDQPSAYPERLESGTLNLPAIAALKEGAEYAANNLCNFSETLYAHVEKLIDGLSKINGVKLYSRPNPVGIVSFSVEGYDSGEVADILDKKYDIAVRGGLHCSPEIHRALKTENGGLIRVSLAVQNGYTEIAEFLRAVKEIAEK